MPLSRSNPQPPVPLSAPGAEPGTVPASGGRAGRNLPVAIAVGLALGALITVPLFTYKALFIAVLAGASALGCVETARALRSAGWDVPAVPLAVGAVATIGVAYLRGPGALVMALLVTVLVAVSWLALPGDSARALRRNALGQVGATALVAVYVPFLAGFAALLTAPADGPRRVTAYVATVVCSDVGGYAAGVLLGRHPLAPTVSPKKSWEGLGGSAAACLVAGIIFFGVMLHAPVASGALYGLAVVVTATLGDLGESMLKRDLGVKDMGSLLPGHGGLMDRLDSMLLTAPVAWMLLTLLVPVHR